MWQKLPPSIWSSAYMPLNVFPLYEHILVKDSGDPTAGGLVKLDEEDDGVKVATGTVVRVGRGQVTKDGVISPVLRKGDSVIFIKEVAIRFENAGEVFYLLPEWATSGILNRDPNPEEIGDFTGIDMDELDAEIDRLERRDPDSSDTQD